MKAAVALTAAMLAFGSVAAYAQGGPDVKGPGAGGGGGGPSLGGDGGGGGPSLRGGGDGGGGGGGPSLRGDGDRGGGFERARPDSAPRAERREMKGPESGSGRAERAGPKEDRASRAYRAERGSSKSDEGSKGRLSRDDDRDGDKSPAAKDTKADKAVKDQVEDQEKSAKDEKEDAAKAAKSEEAIRDREKSETARDADEDKGEPSKSAEDTLRKDGARKDEAKSDKLEKAKEVQLSADKRDRVRDEFRKVTDVKRQTDVDVSISVGRRLPRHWHFYPVPIVVIDLIPEYRDYVFVYVDDEYVICDPDTYEVVAIIDAPTTTAESRGGGGGVCSTDLRLSDKTEGIILGSVRSEDEEEIDGGSLEVGWRVPDSIDLHEFDAAVTASEPGLEFCRYFVSEHQIAIVDPQRDRVVLLVEADR